MKKLKLQMEELAVESFPTSDADAHIGTVRGAGDGPHAAVLHVPRA